MVQVEQVQVNWPIHCQIGRLHRFYFRLNFFFGFPLSIQNQMATYLSFRFGAGESSTTQHHTLAHIPDTQPTHTTFATNPNKSISATKQPYGSGDQDDGYTLVFANIAEFQAWRESEEEQNMVEFVKVSPRSFALLFQPLIVAGRYPWQQSDPSSIQGSYQTCMRQTLTKRAQEVCEEAPRAGP